jgi:hypothetical protein
MFTKLGWDKLIVGGEARMAGRAVGGTARLGTRMYAYGVIRNAGRRGYQDPQAARQPQPRPVPHTAHARRARLRSLDSMTGSFR